MGSRPAHYTPPVEALWSRVRLARSSSHTRGQSGRREAEPLANPSSFASYVAQAATIFQFRVLSTHSGDGSIQTGLLHVTFDAGVAGDLCQSVPRFRRKMAMILSGMLI